MPTLCVPETVLPQLVWPGGPVADTLQMGTLLLCEAMKQAGGERGDGTADKPAFLFLPCDPFNDLFLT